MRKIFDRDQAQKTDEFYDAITPSKYELPDERSVEARAKNLRKALAKEFLARGNHCSKVQRCKQLSCPICRRIFATETLEKNRERVALHGDVSEWQACTFVPEFGKTKIGALPGGGLRGFKDRLRKELLKVDPAIAAILSVDVSCERHAGEKYWQWHVHGLIRLPSADIGKKLGRRFRWSKRARHKQCYRPSKISSTFELDGWLSYMMKPEFKSYVHHTSGEKRRSERQMKISDEAKLAEVLHEYWVSQRLFTVGMSES